MPALPVRNHHLLREAGNLLPPQAGRRREMFCAPSACRIPVLGRCWVNQLGPPEAHVMPSLHHCWWGWGC